MLIALAPPAASVPPTSVIRTSDHEGHPRWASTIVGTVVMSSSSMIRGLVSATYPPIVEVGARREAVDDSAAPVAGRCEP
jgi:hypothetical protein